MSHRYYGHATHEGEQVPMQAGCRPNRPNKPSIRRELHDLAYTEYARTYGHDQSSERLLERGGFSCTEIIGLLADALLRERGQL